MTRNTCKRLGHYMGRQVLREEGDSYSYCAQLVVNYQAFLYKKSIHCRAIAFNRLYFLLEKQKKNKVCAFL